MQRDEIIAKIRGRVAQCRRLAIGITDAKAVKALTDMADEGEADIRRLLTENTGAAGDEI